MSSNTTAEITPRNQQTPTDTPTIVAMFLLVLPDAGPIDSGYKICTS